MAVDTTARREQWKANVNSAISGNAQNCYFFISKNCCSASYQLEKHTQTHFDTQTKEQAQEHPIG